MFDADVINKRHYHDINVERIRPIKKICVFQVKDLKILGRVGRHISLNYFSGKKYNFVHFEMRKAFQNA